MIKNLTISGFIQANLAKLNAISATGRLELEILLCHGLGLTRSQVYAESRRVLSVSELHHLEKLLQRRIKGEPIAYIVGYKEFWSLQLRVTEATLVPRPETELVVEQALQLLPEKSPLKILDLGTGSGAIAIALAHERPNWQIYAIDISQAAARVAQSNVRVYSLSNIQIMVADWLRPCRPNQFHAIVANPPYLANDDPYLQDLGLQFEPMEALVGGKTGMEQIRQLVTQASRYLIPGGWLIIEHGHEQGEAVVDWFIQNNYQQVTLHHDLAGLPRVTLGQTNPLAY